MVCMGNICRSPLAEGILRHKVKNRQIPVLVDSAGTIAYHSGEHPDDRATSTAKKHGIDISEQMARQFHVSDFEEFDKIFVMDANNFSDVLRLARNHHEAEKVEMIMNLVNPEKNIPVPDPYYGGKDGFENVYQMLDQSTEKIIEAIIRGDI